MCFLDDADSDGVLPGDARAFVFELMMGFCFNTDFRTRKCLCACVQVSIHRGDRVSPPGWLKFKATM